MTLDLDRLSKLASDSALYAWHGPHPVHEEFASELDPATVQELIRLARIGMTAEATSSPPAA